MKIDNGMNGRAKKGYQIMYQVSHKTTKNMVRTFCYASAFMQQRDYVIFIFD